MKFKNVFFRKMTILYSLIIGILLMGIYFVFNVTVNMGQEIDKMVRDQNFVLTYNTEQTSIKGVKIIDRVKTAKYLINTDSTLTGNECYANSVYFNHRNIGDSINLTDDETIKCIIKDFKKTDINPYNYLVSEETYNSIKDEKYSYLVNINSFNDLSRIENDEEVTLSVFEFGGSYFEKRVDYENNIYFLIGAVVLLLLIAVVIFYNTKGFIKANAKKANKKDNTLKLTICSTLLTIVNGYITGSVIALFIMLLTEL